MNETEGWEDLPHTLGRSPAKNKGDNLSMNEIIRMRKSIRKYDIDKLDEATIDGCFYAGTVNAGK